MRLSNLFRPESGLAVLAGAIVILSQSGCDAVKDAASDVADRASDAVKGDDAADATPAMDATPAEGSAATAAPPAGPTPEQAISNFMSIPSNKITDANLIALAGLESGLDQVTEIKLSGSALGPQGMEALGKLTSLKKLVYGACQLQGAGYAPLANLTQLEHLDLSNAQFNNAAMQYLSGLTNLKELNLNDTHVTDEAFGALENLKKLEVIRVRKTHVDGSGFQIFTGSPLRVIEAGKTQFGNFGYKFIARMPNLEVLATSEANVNDNALRGVRGCANLKELSIGNNLVSDAGMKSLGGLKSLERLSLANNKAVTNVGLGVMKRLKQVKFLDINGTRCTDQAALELQKLLPDADIMFKGQTL